jgi:hypothetical protein
MKQPKQTRKPARVFGEHLSSERAISLNDHRVYAGYLKSPEWRLIRKAVLSERPACEICGNPAEQVHHHSYHTLVMAGALNQALVSVCESCHQSIEFEQGEKLDHEQARISLVRMLFSRGLHDVIRRLKYADVQTRKYDIDHPTANLTRNQRILLEQKKRDDEWSKKRGIKLAELDDKNLAWIAQNKRRR